MASSPSSSLSYSDNSHIALAKSVKEWLQEQGVQTLYIAPGCPWQNAYAESFHSRFRAECLDRQWFHTVREAAVVVEAGGRGGWSRRGEGITIRYYNQVLQSGEIAQQLGLRAA